MKYTLTNPEVVDIFDYLLEFYGDVHANILIKTGLDGTDFG